MKRYSSDKRTLFAVGFVFIGGLALVGVLIPPITVTDILKCLAEVSAGGLLYLIGARWTYVLLDNETFICKSLFYRRKIPVAQITAFKELPNIPVPSFFVLYRKDDEIKRANIVSTVFGWLTLGELAYDLKHFNPRIELDAKARRLMESYERSKKDGADLGVSKGT